MVLNTFVRKLQSENVIDFHFNPTIPIVAAILVVLVNAIAFGYFKCHRHFFACMQKHRFADFDGRSRRREYVGFYVTNVVFVLDLLILDILIMLLFLPPLLTIIYGIVTFVPHLALLVRRLHDIGVSGWGLLIMFVPGMAALLLLVLCFVDSQAGTNAWGPNPKQILNDGIGDNYMPMLIPTAQVMHIAYPVPSLSNNGSAVLVQNSNESLHHDPELGLLSGAAGQIHQQGDMNDK